MSAQSQPAYRSDAESFCIVTPNYNMAAYLPATIESVIENLQPGDQYYVIDGGSEDGSVDVIRRYEKQLSGWTSEPDRGYADALAKGFSRCSSVYQCWINCGDFLLPGALAQARRALARTGADMVFGDDLFIDEQERVIFRSSGRVASLHRMMLYGGWTPLQDACFWRSALYRRVGGIDPELSVAADYDLFLRFGLAGDCQYVPILFSAFRRHEGQTSMSETERYEHERAAARRIQLDRLCPYGCWPQRLYHWISVRIRARFGRILGIRDPGLAGRPVSSLAAGRHQ